MRKRCTYCGHGRVGDGFWGSYGFCSEDCWDYWVEEVTARDEEEALEQRKYNCEVEREEGNDDVVFGRRLERGFALALCSETCDEDEFEPHVLGVHEF